MGLKLYIDINIYLYILYIPYIYSIYIYLINIYVIMKTMCPPVYHQKSFVATHALGHMMYSYTLPVPMNIYIYIYIYILYSNFICLLYKCHKI